MRADTNMDCKDALPLVPSYLDAELTEAQAAPLRKHLLACQACRASAQSEKNLKRWFVEAEPAAIPRDFAARVARRAFGVPDEAQPALQPVLLPRAPLRQRPAPREAAVLPFVLKLTAAAAVVALLVSVAIRSLHLPAAGDLRADDRPKLTLDQALQRVEQIERTERGLAPVAGAASEPARRP